VGERVESLEALLLVLWVLKNVAVFSPPGWLWHFVVEKSVAVTVQDLLEAEPLERVWLLTVTSELSWGPLRSEVLHCALPSLARVGVVVSLTASLGSGPLGNSEALEDSSWTSVETHVADAFLESGWVEVLGIDVHQDVWLLVEFHCIEILHAHAYIILN
jgi:hypothetical protein